MRYEYQNMIKALPPKFNLKECNRLDMRFMPSALELVHT